MKNATRAKPCDQNHVPSAHARLGEKVMTDITVLFPYLTDSPAGFFTVEEMVEQLSQEMYPEGEVFFWQTHAISTLHALNKSVYSGSDRLIPPRTEELGLAVTMEQYLGFSKELRKKFHENVFLYLNHPDWFTTNRPQDSGIVEPVMEVCESRRGERLAVDKERALSYAKMFRAMC